MLKNEEWEVLKRFKDNLSKKKRKGKVL